MAASDPAHTYPAAGTPPADPAAVPPSATTSVPALLRFGAVMAALLAVASLPASSLVAVRTVTVEGARTVPPSVILARAGVRPGDRVLGIAPAAVARRVEALPRLARASVTVGLAGHVTVRVEERREFAAVPHQGAYLILDRDGVVMDTRPSPGALLVITFPGIVPLWVRPGQRLPAAGVGAGLAAVDELPSAVLRPGTTIRVEPAGEFVLITPDRIPVRLGPLRGLRERSALLPRLLDVVRDRALTLDYLDLRFAGSVVIKPAGAPTAGDRP